MVSIVRLAQYHRRHEHPHDPCCQIIGSHRHCGGFYSACHVCMEKVKGATMGETPACVVDWVRAVRLHLRGHCCLHRKPVEPTGCGLVMEEEFGRTIDAAV